jgi:uncharacterized protein YcgI (DUF1989 family)
MASVLAGHRAVSAKQLETGAAVAFPVQSGQLIQIIDLNGKQVATFTAVGGEDNREHLSTAVTLTANASVLLKVGDRLFSQSQTPMFQIVDDSVKRHDLLTAPLQKGTVTNSVATRDSLIEAANEVGLDGEHLPAPVNFFKQVLIKQRGEIEVKDSFAERNDTLVLRALIDGVVIIANAYTEKRPGQSSPPPANSKRGVLLVRVYR